MFFQLCSSVYRWLSVLCPVNDHRWSDIWHGPNQRSCGQCEITRTHANKHSLSTITWHCKLVTTQFPLKATCPQTLAYDSRTNIFKKASLTIHFSCLPFKINITKRDSVHLIWTISKAYIIYEINKTVRLLIFLLLKRLVCCLMWLIFMGCNMSTVNGAILTCQKDAYSHLVSTSQNL